MQFAALFVVIGALVSDNRDGKFICISLGIMAVSLIGRIITTYFSTMLSAPTMVDSRCAITIRVLPTVKVEMAFCTSASFSGSI